MTTTQERTLEKRVAAATGRRFLLDELQESLLARFKNEDAFYEFLEQEAPRNREIFMQLNREELENPQLSYLYTPKDKALVMDVAEDVSSNMFDNLTLWLIRELKSLDDAFSKHYGSPYSTLRDGIRVAQNSTVLASDIGFDSKSIRRSNFGGFTHDIGKYALLSIDAMHLLYVTDRLSLQEFAPIKLHPSAGANYIARRIKFVRRYPGLIKPGMCEEEYEFAEKISGTHHRKIREAAPEEILRYTRDNPDEYQQKLGYGSVLAQGEALLPETKVVAVSDTNVAILTRPYSRAKGNRLYLPEESAAEIMKNTGIGIIPGQSFDPAIAEALVNRTPNKRRVYELIKS